MAVSGMSAAGLHAANQLAVQSHASHKHGASHFSSNTDIDAAGSSMATAPSPTGKIGSKVNVTV